MLVDEAVDILPELERVVFELRWLVDDRPLAVDEHVASVHACVDDVVHVLAANDPRVERDVGVHVPVQCETATERDGARLDARRSVHDRQRIVERIALAPEHVGGVRLRVALVAPLRVGVVAGLGQHGLAPADLHAETVLGPQQEALVGDDLIVVDEDDRFAAEDRSGDQADVANGAVAHKARAGNHVGELDLLEPAVQ